VRADLFDGLQEPLGFLSAERLAQKISELAYVAA